MYNLGLLIGAILAVSAIAFDTHRNGLLRKGVYRECGPGCNFCDAGDFAHETARAYLTDHSVQHDCVYDECDEHGYGHDGCVCQSGSRSDDYSACSVCDLSYDEHPAAGLCSHYNTLPDSHEAHDITEDHSHWLMSSPTSVLDPEAEYHWDALRALVALTKS